MQDTKRLWFAIIPLLAIACSHKAPILDEILHLAKLKPASQYFRINPAQRNILHAEKGSLFTIGPDSFTLPKHYRAGERVEIHIVEATQSLEFAALPVSLEFQNEGRSTLFEPTGMFFIAAKYEGEDLSLKPNKKIKVKFRTDVSGDKFFVYSHDAEKGNIARTATIDTPKANGHHRNFDMPCFDLGEIKMERCLMKLRTTRASSEAICIVNFRNCSPLGFTDP